MGSGDRYFVESTTSICFTVTILSLSIDGIGEKVTNQTILQNQNQTIIDSFLLKVVIFVCTILLGLAPFVLITESVKSMNMRRKCTGWTTNVQWTPGTEPVAKADLET